jgi:cyclic pyranopterin phosphate synthase
LIRKNIVYLIEKLSGIKGIKELSLTTNGVLLEEMAQDLKDAGLHRINISIDSIEPQIYKEVAGFDLLPKVIKSIYKALKVGLNPVKINSVIIKDINISQILPLARMSVSLPVAVRFIEYCPTNKYAKVAGDYVPTREIRKIIESNFGHLSPVVTGRGSGPASYFKIKNSMGFLGFISSRSSIFCNSCNRLRLTSDGKVKPCLYSLKYYDIKKLIRADAGDEDLLQLMKKILYEKGNFTKLTSPKRRFSMQKIGG